MIKPRKELKDIPPYIPGQNKEGCIKLASNENPLGPSPKAQQAVAKASMAMQLYPDGDCIKLRQTLAKFYKLQPENVIIGNGSDDVLLCIAGAFINKGDKVVISRVTFSGYEFSARLFGGVPVFVPLKNNRYDLTGFKKALAKRPKVVYLCNPNNPTGTIFSDKELQGFLRSVPAGTLVVIDEAYNEYVLDQNYPDSIALLAEFKNIIVLRTFSKIFGLGGLRVGYGLAAKELIAELNKPRAPFNVNKLAQTAALAAFGDESFLAQSADINEEGKAYLYKQLTLLGLSYIKTQANFIYIDLPVPAQDIFKKMMSDGVIVRPLESFGRPFAIRVTIGTSWQNKRFIDALKKALAK
jgi:histidinol-phosphate aminotransferase